MDDPFDLPPDVLKRVPLFAELQKVLSWTGGPVNWDLARQLAVSIAAGESRATPVSGEDHAELGEHVRVAEMWLAEEAGLPPAAHVLTARAATSVDWAEHAVDAYRELIDPIAAKAGRALAGQGSPDGPDAMMAGAIGQIAPLFMGIQTGTMLGAVAADVAGSADIALPPAEGEVVVILEAVDSVAREYQLDRRSARQWVALREAARAMLLDGFPSVRGQFYARYLDYIASLDIDIGRGLSRLQELDMSDPQRLQDALADEGLFTPEPSAETAAASARLDDLLAVLDAFTSAAVEAAAARVGGLAPVGEAFRRRGLSDARGVTMLYRFIGLEPPSPARARAFVRTAIERGGWPLAVRALDAAGSFPTTEEIGDPAAWIGRIGA